MPAQIGEKHRVQVVSQFRLALKSASRADCPCLYCSIVAAGGKLAAVVVPCDRRDQERVRAQWRPDFCLYLCIKELNRITVRSCDLGDVRGKCHASDL